MTCDYIIFSRNRACQLEFLLRSVRANLSGVNKVHVLYNIDDRHRTSYYRLISQCEQYDGYKFTYENYYFKVMLLSLLEESKSEYVFFTPDDGLFIREINVEKILPLLGKDKIFSMRLGTHLKVCHPTGNTEQPLPEFINHGEILEWDWTKGVLDWGYPLALDGHIFNRELILNLLKTIHFKSPSSCEANLQIYKDAVCANYKGLCYEKSSFVSLPWNSVSTEIFNKNAGIPEEHFLELYEKGMRLDGKEIYNTLPVSCHQEYEIKWYQTNGNW